MADTPSENIEKDTEDTKGTNIFGSKSKGSKELKEKEVLTLERDWYDDSRQEMEKLYPIFRECEDAYWGYIKNEDNPWKSSVADPESYEKVERMVSRVFATYPRGKFAARTPDAKGKAEIIEAQVKYGFERDGQNMFPKFRKGGLGMGVHGGSFQLLCWRFEEDKDGNIEWDDPFYKNLYIWDCFPDMNADDIDSMEHFQHNDYVSLKELEDTPEGRYINLDKLKKAIRDAKNMTASNETDRDNVKEIRGTSRGDIKGKVRIRRTYTKDKWYAVAVDYNILIENRENPYWHGQLPVHFMVDNEYPNELFGRGEIEPILPLQRGLNSTLNQRLDNVRLILDTPFKVKGNSKYMQTWQMAPGAAWQMDSLDEVEQFVMQDVTANTFIQTTNYFKDAMAKALGNFDSLSRNETSNDRTATEAKLTAGEQNARMRQKEMLLDNYIKRLMNQWVKLLQQYTTEAKIIRVSGRDAIEKLMAATQVQDPENGGMSMAEVDYAGKKVKKFQSPAEGEYGYLVTEPGDLEGQFDFINESGSMSATDATERVNNLMGVLKVANENRENLMADGVIFDTEPIIKNIATESGVKEVDSLFKPLPQVPTDGSQPLIGGAQAGGAPPLGAIA